MFGFQGGESIDIVVRKKEHMKDAQRKWPFLTTFDCSTMRTAGQLASMIGTRSGIAEKHARVDVDAWMEGKTF